MHAFNSTRKRIAQLKRESGFKIVMKCAKKIYVPSFVSIVRKANTLTAPWTQIQNFVEHQSIIVEHILPSRMWPLRLSSRSASPCSAPAQRARHRQSPASPRPTATRKPSPPPLLPPPVPSCSRPCSRSRCPSLASPSSQSPAPWPGESACSAPTSDPTSGGWGAVVTRLQRRQLRGTRKKKRWVPCLFSPLDAKVVSFSWLKSSLWFFFYSQTCIPKKSSRKKKCLRSSRELLYVRSIPVTCSSLTPSLW